jgi:sulfur-oxidizing protein SoxA
MKLRFPIYPASDALALTVLTLASTLPSAAADKIDPVADA